MGTRSAKASIKVEIETLIRNVLAAGNPSAEMRRKIEAIVELTSGTTGGKIDRVLVSEGRALSGASSETIDLYDLGSLNIGAGAGLDALGQAWVGAEIVGLFIRNNDTADSLVIGNDGTSAAWNSLFGGDDEAAITLLPGAMILLIASGDPAYAVADSTNHLLKIAAPGSAISSYDLVILARSA